MQIRIDRKYKKEGYTIGKLYLDGVYFCDTLEDKVRELGRNGEGKIYGMTAIPAGSYKVRLTFSPKFRRVLPLLENVPFYEGIRIHAGNTAKDTLGCILVGKNNAVGRVNESRKTENALVAILKEQKEIRITIK